MFQVLTTVDIGTSPLLAAAVGFGALGTLLIIAGALALLGLHPARFALRTVIGLIFLSVAALAGLMTAGLQGYRALTREELAARLSVRPTGPQRFTVVVRVPGAREATYSIAGDEITVEAHILKWKPLVNMLGLHTAYELGRVGGRYRDIRQERSGPRTVYSLAEDRTVDLFDLRQEYALLGPFVDAEYGSATFVSVTRPAELEVRVSTTGLLLREVGR